MGQSGQNSSRHQDSSTHSLTSVLDGVVGQSQDSVVLTREREQAFFLQKAGWAPRPVTTGVEEDKPLHPTGFELLTIQLLASRYIDYSTPVPATRDWTDINI